jgi:hypothetical protein
MLNRYQNYSTGAGSDCSSQFFFFHVLCWSIASMDMGPISGSICSQTEILAAILEVQRSGQEHT